MTNVVLGILSLLVLGQSLLLLLLGRLCCLFSVFVAMRCLLFFLCCWRCRVFVSVCCLAGVRGGFFFFHFCSILPCCVCVFDASTRGAIVHCILLCRCFVVVPSLLSVLVVPAHMYITHQCCVVAPAHACVFLAPAFGGLGRFSFGSVWSSSLFGDIFVLWVKLLEFFRHGCRATTTAASPPCAKGP